MNENQNSLYGSGVSQPQDLNKTLSGVFIWMLAGLAVTALVSYITVSTPALIQMIMLNPVIYVGLIIAELIMVIVLSAAINKLNSTVAAILFLAYSAINGLTLSAIFISYELGSVVLAFVISAAMFGAMAIYGYATKRDLTKIGSFLFMALFGVFLAIIVNMFLRSSVMDFIISLVAVIVFVGLTAWDVQKIKNAMAQSSDSEFINKRMILGALQLYLDFINIFIHLLRLIGRRH